MKKPNEAQYKSAMKKIVSASGLPVKLGVFGEYFYDRFSNTMPPISFTGSSVLTSEPYGFNDNWEDTYLGFFEKSGEWYGVLTTRKEWIAKSFKKHKDPTGLNAPKKLVFLNTAWETKLLKKLKTQKLSTREWQYIYGTIDFYKARLRYYSDDKKHYAEIEKEYRAYLNAVDNFKYLETQIKPPMNKKTTKDKIPYDQKRIDAIAGRLLADDLTPSKFTKKAALEITKSTVLPVYLAKFINAYPKEIKAAMTKMKGLKAPKKRISARTICRKVIDVPGINKRTGQLLKGWHYVNGKPAKVTKRKPAKKSTKGLKGATMCTRLNTNGTITRYSTHGGNKPCPYGGRPMITRASKLTPASTTYALNGTKKKPAKKK